MPATAPPHSGAPADATPDRTVVLSQALLRAATLLGLSNGALARILGVSEAGISRLASGARRIDPASKEGELALLLIRLYRSLDALVGNDAARRQAWFDSHNRALNGRPSELVLRAEGLAAVVAYLDAMRAPL
jgi:transcriptional regulator with XRE-family HTH domain